VLEQAAGVGLVVVLGGWRLAESLPRLGPPGEEAIQELAERAVLDRPDQLAKVGLEQLG
jgi:hypothetical protein